METKLKKFKFKQQNEDSRQRTEVIIRKKIAGQKFSISAQLIHNRIAFANFCLLILISILLVAQLNFTPAITSEHPAANGYSREVAREFSQLGIDSTRYFSLQTPDGQGFNNYLQARREVEF